ncbi:MAG: FAD-dependent oxidoreductase [Leptolyngbya sp. SIO4C1]|nr:FAD-dependent oxidoreductase [Leptolyngbya sp. SIO4C1]
MTQRVAACQISDLEVGQMQQFSVADQEILLARLETGFYATAAHCSHYGAPLVNGVLQGDRVVCPWHNACFNVTSGAMLEPPGRNHLRQYPTEIEADTVYVKLPETAESAHVLPALAAPDTQADSRTFAIVGGGAAGSAAAEMLRQVGFQGKIIIFSDDSQLPYDRTALSKSYLQSDTVNDPSLLRSADFYQQYGIEVKTEVRVSQIDVAAQQLTYGDSTLRYDALLLATGGKIRQLPVAGADLENVFTLRSAADAKAILRAAQTAKHAVIIGAGFIGMEVAASLKQQGLSVTVVAPSSVPFEKVLGKPVGQLFQQIHQAQGVQFRLGTKATELQGDTQVKSVVLENGETLQADLAVVGIGVDPATELAQGLALDDDDSSILVNQYLQAAPGVYAAGDIAKFPHFMTGEPVRIEHWRLALQHGRIAACNMAGQTVPFKAVPFFWTGQFDIKLRYIGHAESWDDLIIQGSLDNKSFLAFYSQAGQVLAVAGAGRDRDIAAISELMRLGQMPAAEAIKKTDIDWSKQLAK